MHAGLQRKGAYVVAGVMLALGRLAVPMPSPAGHRAPVSTFAGIASAPHDDSEDDGDDGGDGDDSGDDAIEG
jgi:hypothetical protein